MPLLRNHTHKKLALLTSILLVLLRIKSKDFSGLPEKLNT